MKNNLIFYKQEHTNIVIVEWEERLGIKELQEVQKDLLENGYVIYKVSFEYIKCEKVVLKG